MATTVRTVNITNVDDSVPGTWAISLLIGGSVADSLVWTPQREYTGYSDSVAWCDDFAVAVQKYIAQRQPGVDVVLQNAPRPVPLVGA